MAKKSSVYFGQGLSALTKELAKGDSVSGRINRAAERYLAIVKNHGVALTDDERRILGNCLSGSWIDPLLIRHLADEVVDSKSFEESNTHAKSLEAKLRSASFADLVATVEELGF